MTEDVRTINPNTRVVSIGAKKPREIIIYPLSIGDQIKLTDRFSNVINDFGNADRENMSVEDMINQFKYVIQDNLPEIMSYVINPDENDVPTLDEITNRDLYEITKAIFEINYEGIVKNFTDLFKRMTQTVSQENG